MATTSRTHIGDALVAAVLCSPLHKVLDRRIALLTLVGRRSGRSIRVPVDYTRDGRVVHVLSRIDHQWWHNLEGGAHLMIRLGGIEYSAFGEVREMTGADRIRFVQEFWQDAYGHRLDAEHAADLAHSAVIVRILLTDD